MLNNIVYLFNENMLDGSVHKFQEVRRYVFKYQELRIFQRQGYMNSVEKQL